MQTEVQGKTAGRKQVAVWQSIKVKILLLVIVAIAATSAINLVISIPMVKENTSGLVKNYMNDLAKISGRNLDREIGFNGAGNALAAQELSEQLGSVKVEGMDSSYSYVVAPDGTMLYHPSADKIGAPVENAAVKQLLGELSRGRRPETDVITYDFNGVNKYASYYIGEGMDYILVVTADEEEAFESANSMAARSVAGSALALAVCGVLSILTAVLLTRPITKITREIIRLADLDFTDNGRLAAFAGRGDETGAMAYAAVTLQEKLRGVIGNIREHSRELHEASNAMNTGTDEVTRSIRQVDKAVTEVADGATSQAQDTQTATENIILMGDMIAETGSEVENLRTIAGEMRSAGERAIGILAELDDINQQTKNAVQLIYDQINRTNESVADIRTATEIISNIAEETNLLSLNASIEAARAGEAGRGFAVVAFQIQQLADQSNTSAGQINETISSLISGFSETMKTMESVKQVIGRQDEDVANTEKAFDDVKDGILKSIDGIRGIAAKSEKLDEARVKVVDVVQSLTAIAQENAASTEETSAAVTEVNAIMFGMADSARQLYKIANELDESVKQFRFG